MKAEETIMLFSPPPHSDENTKWTLVGNIPKAPTQQMKPYINTSDNRELWSPGNGRTQSKYLKAYVKAQKSKGSPTYISSHLFGQDLRDYQFKFKEGGADKNLCDLPTVKKLRTREQKLQISRLVLLHFTFSHLKACYQVKQSSISSNTILKDTYPKPKKELSYN